MQHHFRDSIRPNLGNLFSQLLLSDNPFPRIKVHIMTTNITCGMPHSIIGKGMSNFSQN